MSSDKAPPPSVFRRLRPPAAMNYLVMTSVGLVIYAMIMVAKGNDAGALIALLLAVPGILARWTASPILVLLLTIYLAIDPRFGGLVGYVTFNRWRPDYITEFSIFDIILAGSLLTYMIGHFRLTSIVYQSIPEDPTVRKDRDPLNPPRRPVELIGPDELPRSLFVAGGCVVVGLAGWFTIVLIDRIDKSRISDFSIGGSRLLLVVWFTGLTLMIVSAALIYMRGNRMTRTEAMLSLRDEFFQENRRETDRLLRWRRWFKERVAIRRRSGK